MSQVTWSFLSVRLPVSLSLTPPRLAVTVVCRTRIRWKVGVRSSLCISGGKEIKDIFERPDHVGIGSARERTLVANGLGRLVIRSKFGIWTQTCMSRLSISEISPSVALNHNKSTNKVYFWLVFIVFQQSHSRDVTVLWIKGINSIYPLFLLLVWFS